MMKQYPSPVMFLVVLLLLPLTTLARRYGPRIVGGMEATPHEFPWIVALYRDGEQICAGTILSEDAILTAAHCLDRQPNSYAIAAGDHILDYQEGTEQGRQVFRILKHEMFNKTPHYLEHDIALMWVRPPLNFNVNVQAATLPLTNFVPPDSAIAAGWGRTDAGAPRSEVLKKAVVYYADPYYCRQAHLPWYSVPTDNVLCYTWKVDEERVGTCKGDSGGPLLCGDTTVCGIVSWGKPCAHSYTPDIYTDVYKHLDWINDHLENPPEMYAVADKNSRRGSKYRMCNRRRGFGNPRFCRRSSYYYY